MQIFKAGNLGVGAILKSKLQNIYTPLSEKKLKYAIAYFSGYNYKSNNVGIASLQSSKLCQTNDFIAFNNVNNRHDIKIQDRKVLKNFCLDLCLEDFKTLYVQRLKVDNLETYIPQSLGFAKGKSHCTERKILSKILREMYKNKIPNGSLQGTLYLYTKLEPCAYCVNAIQEFIDLTGTKVYLLYEELIFEIVRDNLSTGPNFLTDIIKHTDYKKLDEYDPVLADMIKQDYKNRGKSFLK